MGKALRRDARPRGRWGRPLAYLIGWASVAAFLLFTPLVAKAAADEPLRFTEGRFTVMAYAPETRLARFLLARALAQDSFPGLPLPRQPVLIQIAPDHGTFREWAGAAPEWGSAVAFPREGRVVLQGRSAGADAGDPAQTLRHELAHLALWEALGERVPRWFDEGYASYAAGEWGREELLATSLALVVRGVPGVEELEGWFYQGPTRARTAYALAYRAVAELAAIDQERGLTLFLQYWRESGSMEAALRRAYGLTLAGFDQYWGRRTLLRYGALAVVGNLSLALGVIAILVLPLYLMRRRRDRLRLAALREADAAAERTGELDELLRSADPTVGHPPPPASPSSDIAAGQAGEDRTPRGS